jgi:hypothetical protein
MRVSWAMLASPSEVAACLMVLMVAGFAPKVLADTPPPLSFEPQQGGSTKSARIVVFHGDEAVVRGSERRPAGIVVETGSYCHAVIDIIASRQAHAKLEVEGAATGSLSDARIPEVQPIQIGGDAEAAGARSVVVPLRHRVTPFYVGFYDDGQDRHGPILVQATAIPCTFSIDRW